MDRRFFLKMLLAGALCPRFVHGAVSRQRDENLVAVLSDTHVGMHDDGRQESGFRRCLGEILSQDTLPGTLLILGDFSYSKGLLGDYRLLRRLMRPVEKAGIRWHVAMGNHDRREAFEEIFPEHRATLLPGKHVQLVETPHLDFLLLDSLVEGRSSGALGAKQEAWLREFLSARRKKTLICAHHSLLELHLGGLLAKYPCVAGFLNGHHHQWYQLPNWHGIRNWVMPSTGHWGDIGYGMMSITPQSAVLKISLQDVYVVGKATEEKLRSRRLRLSQLKKSVKQAVFPL